MLWCLARGGSQHVCPFIQSFSWSTGDPRHSPKVTMGLGVSSLHSGQSDPMWVPVSAAPAALLVLLFTVPSQQVPGGGSVCSSKNRNNGKWKKPLAHVPSAPYPRKWNTCAKVSSLLFPSLSYDTGPQPLSFKCYLQIPGQSYFRSCPKPGVRRSSSHFFSPNLI